MWDFKHRPEINARHSAFKRGADYLERYCLLIAFAAFLERKRHTQNKMPFSDWLASRPDIDQALDTIHQNPGGALAPVPASRLPTLWVALTRSKSKQVSFSSSFIPAYTSESRKNLMLNAVRARYQVSEAEQKPTLLTWGRGR